MQFDRRSRAGSATEVEVDYAGRQVGSRKFASSFPLGRTKAIVKKKKNLAKRKAAMPPAVVIFKRLQPVAAFSAASRCTAGDAPAEYRRRAPMAVRQCETQDAHILLSTDRQFRAKVFNHGALVDKVTAAKQTKERRR